MILFRKLVGIQCLIHKHYIFVPNCIPIVNDSDNDIPDILERAYIIHKTALDLKIWKPFWKQYSVSYKLFPYQIVLPESIPGPKSQKANLGTVCLCVYRLHIILITNCIAPSIRKYLRFEWDLITKYQMPSWKLFCMSCTCTWHLYCRRWWNTWVSWDILYDPENCHGIWENYFRN